MKSLKSFLTNAFLQPFHLLTIILAFALLNISCSWAKETNDSVSEKVFVASTPGDSLIKSLLLIPSETNVDFIKWELMLNSSKEKQPTFILNIEFGESQPNTLGFKEGKKKTMEGEYSISKNETATHSADVYHLKSSQFQQEISIVKLNEHLLHILTPHNQLMVGNGGYI